MAKCFSRSLTQEELKYARKKRRMEVRLRIFLQDFISYVIFLMFLAFVARGYRDTDGYYFSKALTDDIVHQHFEHVSLFSFAVSLYCVYCL